MKRHVCTKPVCQRCIVNKRNRIRRVLAKADGKCTSCFIRTAMDGYAQCGKCYEVKTEALEALRNARLDAGKCRDCGADANWKTQCPACRAKGTP